MTKFNFCNQLQQDLLSGGKIIWYLQSSTIGTILVRLSAKDEDGFEYHQYTQHWDDNQLPMYLSTTRNGHQKEVVTRTKQDHHETNQTNISAKKMQQYLSSK